MKPGPTQLSKWMAWGMISLRQFGLGPFTYWPCWTWAGYGPVVLNFRLAGYVSVQYNPAHEHPTRYWPSPSQAQITCGLAHTLIGGGSTWLTDVIRPQNWTRSSPTGLDVENNVIRHDQSTPGWTMSMHDHPFQFLTMNYGQQQIGQNMLPTSSWSTRFFFFFFANVVH